jgi:hypothetical protein
MYPDMDRDFLGPKTSGSEGGTKMTDAHSIIGIEKCDFHGGTIIEDVDIPYRACAG